MSEGVARAPSGTTAVRARARGRARGPVRRPTWLVVPAVVLLLIVIGLPAAVDIYISFFRVDISTLQRWYVAPFVGIANYVNDLTTNNILSGSVQHALFVSVTFALLATAIATPIGFTVAICVSHRFVGRGLVRAWFLVPYVMPSVVTAMVGRALFQGDTGLVDQGLADLGLAGRNSYWLIGPKAFWAMVIVEVWAVWPFIYIMVLAGLSSVSAELYEAAELDGAGYVAKLRYVTIPQVRNVLLLAVLLSTIFHLANFTLPFVMFSNPPPASVDVLPLSIYYSAFTSSQYSLAAASAVLMVIIILVPGIVYLRMTRLSQGQQAR